MIDENGEVEWLAPWLAITLTLIGGGLRLFLIGNKVLRIEEAISLWVSSHSLVDMLPWIARIDHQPPLYYILLHYWTALNGTTPSDIRLLSALFGAATIPVIYLIGKRLSGVAMGLAAAVLLALSPFNIRFAQEARMYSLLGFNTAVAIYALVRLLTDPRSINPLGSQFREYLHVWRTSGPVEPGPDAEFSYKDKTRYRTGWRAWFYRHRWLPISSIETDLAWVVFIIFSTATLYTHNSGVLFPLAFNIFVLGLMLYQKIKKSGPLPAFQAPSFRNWVIVQIVILLLWSPWIFAFVQQSSRVFQDFWLPSPTWNTVIQTLKSLLNDTTLSQSTTMTIIWILYALVLCFGLVHYRKKISPFLFLAALFTIPFVGELLVSTLRPIYFDRTLIWTAIPLFIFLAAGIMQLRFRLLIFLVIGILATNNLFTAGDYYKSVQKEEWDNVAGFVANFVQTDDLILFNATKVQIPFDYYFIPYEKLYFFQVEKHGVPVDMFDSGTMNPGMTQGDVPRLISLLNEHKRVWLVYSHDGTTDPMGLIPQTLASQMQLFYTRDFYAVRVQIYAVP
jgi:mannosyltransferase